MDWSHLKVVLAIARGGSLTAAAQIMGSDQTTIGRRLTALERSLGRSLFVRSKAGFLATDEGQRAIAIAEQMERDAAQLAEDLADPDAGASGVVRLMGNTWMLQRLAGTALPALLQDNPRLTLRMSGRLPPTPIHSEPTISLWFDAAARAPDRSHPMATVPYGAYRADGTSVDPNRWVLFQDDDAQGPSFTRLVQKRLGKSASIAMTATDASVLASAVKAGVGTGLLPKAVGQSVGGIHIVPDEGQAVDRVLHLHVNPQFQSLKRVTTVLDWLTTAVGPALGATLLPSFQTGLNG